MDSFAPRLRALLAITMIGAGCVELASNPEEELGETTSELSTTSWSPRVLVAHADDGAAVATINGTTFMVRSEFEDESDSGAMDLAWLKRTGPGAWTSSTVIPAQTSIEHVSLAAFNGFIYMIRQGTQNDVYMARFNPNTSVWSQSWLLPYRTEVMPTIVVFQNQLRLVGNTPGTYQMWTATMNTAEVFSQAALLPGKYTQTRPSAAVFKNRMYVAHKQLATFNIIYSRFDGTTWTANSFILAGPNGARALSYEPVLAAVNGFLHIVYASPPPEHTVKWSYFDGCVWSPEVSIGSLATADGYSLAQGGPGLVLITTGTDPGNDVYALELTAPPAPLIPPSCSVVNP